MDLVGILVFRTLVMAMLIMTIAGLSGIAGRNVRELSVLEIIFAVPSLVIAGISIVDWQTDFGIFVTSLILIGFIQCVLGRITYKFKSRTALGDDRQPVILISKGRIKKDNLRKNSLELAVLFKMLREKGVFDIHKVELCLLEADGTISVLLKAAEPGGAFDNVKSASALPVVLEGQPQRYVLEYLGFDEEQVERFISRHSGQVKDIYLALLDEEMKFKVDGIIDE